MAGITLDCSQSFSAALMHDGVHSALLCYLRTDKIANTSPVVSKFGHVPACDWLIVIH